MKQAADFFCGRFGWGKPLAEAGFKVRAVDNVPQNPPPGVDFTLSDCRALNPEGGRA